MYRTLSQEDILVLPIAFAITTSLKFSIGAMHTHIYNIEISSSKANCKLDQQIVAKICLR